MKSLHFLYHELRVEKSAYTYVTAVQEFDAHCALFGALQRQPDGKVFRPEVTFDDGNESDVLLAQPVLERHGLLGSFFITAGWTERRRGFMSFAQLRGLRAGGHRVGAHGMTHALLTGCSEQALTEELNGARRRLEDGLGEAVRSMSLPGGRMNSRVLAACQQAGFEQIFTSIPRAEEMASHPGTVGRLNLLGGTSVAWLQRVLESGSGVLTQLERRARAKETAKRLLGDRLYGRLWAIGNRQHTDPEMEANTR